MRRVWNDIKSHRLSAVLFLLYWLIAFGLDAFGWQKRENRPDMVRTVIYLHLLLPIGAGALVSWWRRRDRPGGVAAGMLAGALVLAVDSVALLTHQWIASGLGETGGSGERVSEVPVFLIAVGLLGSLLGLIGAAAAGLGRLLDVWREPPSDPFGRAGGTLPRRLLRVAGGLALGAAVLVLVGVIPPLAAGDIARTSPKALPAFAANAILNSMIGIGLFAAVSRRSSGAGKVLVVMSGFVCLLLGFALLDAASVFAADGSGRLVPACASLAGATGDLGAGSLALSAALRPARIRF